MIYCGQFIEVFNHRGVQNEDETRNYDFMYKYGNAFRPWLW